MYFEQIWHVNLGGPGFVSMSPALVRISGPNVKFFANLVKRVSGVWGPRGGQRIGRSNPLPQVGS
jgi:hypothetical protein